MYREIYEKFKIVGINHFYGDFFDSRVYVSHLLSNLKTDNVLDIGCGAGVLLSCMPPCFKVGIDMNLDALKQIKKLDDSIEAVLGDAQYLPFKTNTFSTITAMHLFPVINILGGDWKKSIDEVKRVAKNKNLLFVAGANRTSKHFKNTHSLEDRQEYLTPDEQKNILEKNYDVKLEGFGPHPNWVMFPFKIIYKIPDKITEFFKIEKILFKFLKSKKYLKDGRSYVMVCKTKEMKQK